MKDMIAVGEILIDLTQTGYTEAGVPLFAAYPGGAPANVAVAASRLGANAALIAKTGADSFGSYLRRTLSENNVDISQLHSGSGATTMAIVSVRADGEREFQFVRGADCALVPEEIDESFIRDSKILHFGSVSLTAGIARSATIRSVRAAHQNGVLVSYDPNYRAPLWRSEKDAIEWMALPLPVVDIIKLSEQELPMLTGSDDFDEGSRRLENMGVSLILITLGGAGAFCRWQGENFTVPGVPVAHVADTNGAGDTFFGAVLSRLCRRGDRPLAGLERTELQDIVAFANHAAAITCSRSGAIPAMPYLNELEKKPM